MYWRPKTVSYPAAGALFVLMLAHPPGVQAGDDVLPAFEGLAPLPTETLDSSHAKAALQIDRIQINDQNVTGVVTGNVAIDNETGDNNLTDGAFMNSAGFMTTIQNTGNNVLIQNSTIINVAVEP